ncbi:MULTISPECIES: toprim domain-containing protein [Bacillus]|uniref:toprim domain-containing protein n=1 Tax=Bacillus TaxID=1386 RepID=UPI000E4834B5|nr:MULTISPECIES: toprim domain-containing protein [Bacillus subtilis group]MBT3123370.1 toprim domain-containing protein [Bacillus inaquosorum]MCB4338958.1 DNA primase [Bacillus subtilis]MCB5337156.1 DNA primase [Bacillus amyloliquefaciens]MCF7615482.1 toprim domain-containing protein [Bacillus subtilis]MCL9628476.1 toprim domain-containing protein [Bacillus subtilis]
MAHLKYKDLVKFLIEDEDQKIYLKELADYRKGDIRTYIKRGIFCVPALDELDYILKKLDLTIEDLGLSEETASMLDRGFIIPVWGSRLKPLFLINYSWLRDKSKKYINVYPAENREYIKKMKLYGAHNLKQGLIEDRMFVVEGAFDVLRLEQYGIPASCILGTKTMPYHKHFYARFTRVIFVSDEDGSGDAAYRQFKKDIPHAERLRITGRANDVDEFGGSNTREFQEWIEYAKTLGVKNRNLN